MRTASTTARRRAALGLAFAAVYLLWGATFLATRYVVAEIPSLLSVTVRCLGGALLLYLWLWARGALLRLTRPQWRTAAAAAAHGRGELRMSCATAMPLGARGGDNVRRMLHGEPLEPFGFDFVLRCLSLGRRDGLVQFTRWDDTPVERQLTGRPAAVTKELIARATMWATRAETRFGISLLRWPTRRARARSSAGDEPAPGRAVVAEDVRGDAL